MIPPALATEIRQRLAEGMGVQEISALLAVPMADVQEVHDRTAAAPRDHRLDSLLDTGEASHNAATRRLAARTRSHVDQLRRQVAEEAKERKLRAEVDRLTAALALARQELKMEKAR